MNLQETLLRSAEVHEQNAKALLECHTIGPEHSDWIGELEAKAEHNDLLVLAAECRRHAALEYALVERVDLDRTIESAKPEVQAAADSITATTRCEAR